MSVDVKPYKPSSGIPTARNVDHVAYTVPDLDQAVQFFVEVLGAEIVYLMGPTEDPVGSWMKDRLNVPTDSVLHFAMVRCGPNLNIEIYEYSSSDQRHEGPRNCDWGGHHMAFYVTDIDAAVTYLKGVEGVRFLGDPELVIGGPIGGTRWVYFLSPWGMQFELVTYGELPYVHETEARQYGPAPAWQNRD